MSRSRQADATRSGTVHRYAALGANHVAAAASRIQRGSVSAHVMCGSLKPRMRIGNNAPVLAIAQPRANATANNKREEYDRDMHTRGDRPRGPHAPPTSLRSSRPPRPRRPGAPRPPSPRIRGPLFFRVAGSGQANRGDHAEQQCRGIDDPTGDHAVAQRRHPADVEIRRLPPLRLSDFDAARARSQRRQRFRRSSASDLEVRRSASSRAV